MSKARYENDVCTYEILLGAMHTQLPCGQGVFGGSATRRPRDVSALMCEERGAYALPGVQDTPSAAGKATPTG